LQRRARARALRAETEKKHFVIEQNSVDACFFHAWCPISAWVPHICPSLADVGKSSRGLHPAAGLEVEVGVPDEARLVGVTLPRSLRQLRRPVCKFDALSHQLQGLQNLRRLFESIRQPELPLADFRQIAGCPISARRWQMWER
jgi:hypothetical protein